MKIRENFDLKKIIVPKKFFDTPPSEKKIYQKRSIILNDRTGVFITIDNKKRLIDGFASYLAAGSLNISRLNVRQLNFFETIKFRDMSKTVYVYGYHPNSNNNIYMWRVTDIKKETLGTIRVGDKLMVSTKKGPAPIIVTKVKKTEFPPTVKKVKTVIGRITD